MPPLDRPLGALSLIDWLPTPSGRGGHVAAGLIIQTILLDSSRSVWIDDPSNLSRPDPSGADQIDAEHQASDLAVARPNHVASGRQGDVEQVLGVDEVVVAVGIGLRSVTVTRGVTDPGASLATPPCNGHRLLRRRSDLALLVGHPLPVGLLESPCPGDGRSPGRMRR
jgi:hypothetical protein